MPAHFWDVLRSSIRTSWCEAHRLTVARSPKTEEEIPAALESQIGIETTDAVRAVVTPS